MDTLTIAVYIAMAVIILASTIATILITVRWTIRWVQQVLERAVEHAMTTTAGQLEASTVKVVGEVAREVASGVGDAVVRGSVEGLEGVMKAGLWGPKPDETATDQPNEQAVPEPAGNVGLPWEMWGQDGVGGDESWLQDATDNAYPPDVSMDPADRTVSLPYGANPLDSIIGPEMPAYDRRAEELHIEGAGEVEDHGDHQR